MISRALLTALITSNSIPTTLQGNLDEIKTLLRCDNQGAISISKNDIDHKHTKHIEIKHHGIRDALKKKTVELKWIPTEFQIADLFTKSLSKIRFKELTTKIMNSN